jgi:hypothetical protein
MGEYADDYFRKEVKEMFGYDPGSGDYTKKPCIKFLCPKCKKKMKSEISVKDHLRDYHKIK